ncbi:calponin homology domain-containing protein [Gorgonomyces haynaldii]|nr:calponin homology domain-containing protein [Gorgonomyces haynaldii]
MSVSKAATEIVQDTAKIFDKSWESIQKKTFTNWFNNQLKKKNLPPVSNLDQDLSSGENLIQLLEIIGDESLGRYNKNPKLRLQKIENCNKALEFIKKRGVHLTNIGAEDIVDVNQKLLLGLIWTIILRFTIADISEEGLTAKEGLLLWCQRRTAPYSADFTIKEFTFSWQSGLALCALIHRHRPDLLDYYGLDKNDKHGNTQLAFDVAEKHLGIPKLFAVEDLVDVVKPDERSVMTYVAQYFHAFSSMDRYGVAGRRVGNIGQVLQQTWEMQNDYERRVRALIGHIASITSEWSNAQLSGLADARRQLKDFENYKATSKRSWVSERRELDTLLSNIQTKLKTYNLRPYTPPEGLATEDVQSQWQHLVNAESQRKKGLTKYIRDAKDAIAKSYAKAANDFIGEVNQVSVSLGLLSGELENQLATTKQLQQQLVPLQQQLQQIAHLNEACNEALIEDNEFTIYSLEDLAFELSLIEQTLTKKVSFIENQIIARTKTNFTPQQLEEYSESFRHFDKDNSNSLTRQEFKAALAAEGTALQDEEFERTFLKVSQGKDEITFEEFLEYARSVEEDKATPEQLLAAFQTLAGDKDFVTDKDLYQGGLSQAVVEQLKQHLPQKNDGYDFAAFVQHIFI